ncbi:MAG TPA: alpha/beta hydrolase [Gemmatimonadales bacterium]|nr:alpha/beta hydrolase [Gemmatimonadales bacterium]
MVLTELVVAAALAGGMPAFGMPALGVPAFGMPGAVRDTVQPGPVVAEDIAVAPGETLRVTSQGQGAPVVLVSGLFGGAYGWRRVMPALAAQGHRVIAIDPLGTGWSTTPKRADYSLTAQAGRVGQVLDSLGVRRALLVANAVGASMALRLALQRPGLVRGIVSLDGGAAETAATPGLKKAMRWAGLLKLFMGPGSVRKKVRAGMRENSADTTWITPAVVEGYAGRAAANVGGAIDAFSGMAHAVEPAPLGPRLPTIHVPFRLLIGTAPHGAGVGPVEAAALAAALPDFAVDSVPGAGQYLAEERPAAVVAAVTALARTARP